MRKIFKITVQHLKYHPGFSQGTEGQMSASLSLDDSS